MTATLAICVAVTFAVSIYLLLGRDLKGAAMGVFLLGHAANLSIIAMSRSPIVTDENGHTHLKASPILLDHIPVKADDPLAHLVDPLPQALILTAIVIGFGVMAFLLTMMVATGRKTHTLEIDELAREA